MGNENVTNSNGGEQSSPETPKVVRGSILDYAQFEQDINAEVRRLAAVRRKWAGQEQTAILLFIVDLYYSVIDDRPFDVKDIEPAVERYSNMGAVYNRLSDAKLIDREGKKGRNVTHGLL